MGTYRAKLLCRQTAQNQWICAVLGKTICPLQAGDVQKRTLGLGSGRSFGKQKANPHPEDGDLSKSKLPHPRVHPKT